MYYYYFNMMMGDGDHPLWACQTCGGLNPAYHRQCQHCGNYGR